jgi:hypothetical protein
MKKILSLLLLFTLIFQCAHAANESFSRDDVKKLNSYFVKKGCNIDGFLAMAEDYDFINQIDSGGNIVPFEKLKKSELCLMSRSYTSRLRLYFVDAKGKIDTSRLLKVVESKYPNDFKPNYLLFKIPDKMALQCDDNGVFSTAIIFKKIDGKINREIRMDRDRTYCDVGELGLPKDFDK